MLVNRFRVTATATATANITFRISLCPIAMYKEVVLRSYVSCTSSYVAITTNFFKIARKTHDDA